MNILSKNQFSSAKAVGRGDWHKVIELESEALSTETDQQEYRYSMIGFAYNRLKEYPQAKANLAKALAYDPFCEMALQELAEIYVEEKNYEMGYQYVLKGLNSVNEIDYTAPKFMKTLMAVLLKMFRPSRSYAEIRAETEEMDQSRNQWVNWANKYKKWYEENYGMEDSPNVH
jgi:tetratricopeptide (TPR) repeat protein